MDAGLPSSSLMWRLTAGRRASKLNFRFAAPGARKKIDAELEADRADDYSYTIERVYCTAAQKTSLIAPL